MIELAPNHKRGLGLAHPVMNASGILGFGREYRLLIDLACLGAFVTNALTWKPRTPAHPPNVVPLPNGILVHTGLPNPGVNAAVRLHHREWMRLGPPVIVHLAATAVEDVARSIERLDRAEGVSGIELGLRDDVTAEEVVQLVRAALSGPPLMVRLPVMRSAELCEAAARAGADALTVGAPPRRSAQIGDHTLTGRLYSPESFSAALEALRAVVRRDLGLPVIGAGGIFSTDDAQAMLAAGAAAVQVDAALWRQPRLLAEWELSG
jgi:dihydroorotate dehydrogenase (NAD+) catalytic subunit